MEIVKERSRIIFSDYTPKDKKIIDELVGTIDRVYSYEDAENGKIYLPAGLIVPVKKLFPKTSILDRSNMYWQHASITPVSHSAEPRNDLQKDAISHVIKNAKDKNKVGLILGPGVGKTFMGCYSAIKVGLRTLIIAPTTSIKKQWAETLTGMFKIPESRVLLTDSPKSFINVKHDFVVTTQASLAVLNKKYDLERIMKSNKFGTKIIDEAHMFFHNIIKVDGSSNILHNWYLTATFGRSGEEENNLYQQMFGDIRIFSVPDKKPTLLNRKPGDIYGQKPHMNATMIWTKSGLTDEEIKKVSSSKRYSEKEGKWMRYGLSVPAYTNLVIPPDGTVTRYMKKILEVFDMSLDVKYGRTLILSATIESTEILARLIRQKYPKLRVGTVHSHNKPIHNDKVKAEHDVVISTVKSSGTGFDMKDLSKLIVCEPFKSWILTDQVSGRLRRRPDGRETHMWDIVDSQVPQLRAWANARAVLLKRKSKKFIVKDL